MVIRISVFSILASLFMLLPAGLISDRAVRAQVAVGSPGIRPARPQTRLKTTYSAPTGNTVFVRAGDDLQAAIDSALPGDEIVLEAGAVYKAPYEGFQLRPKSGKDWITIRTSDMAGISKEGTRIDPALHSAAMPKIVSRGPGPALATAVESGSGVPQYYRLVGIEFTIEAGVTINYGLLSLGASGSAQTSLSQAPHDLIIDRCYIHGHDNADISRGVALNSARTAIIDSYISEIHGRGFDTQAICGWNGPGPFKIENNYLEAAGENVLFGGADPKIPDLAPSDIEFRRNHCFKPLSWKSDDPSYGGNHWTVKNLFELKNARRVIIEGNVFENNWADAQNGFGILFTVRNQDGKAPWSVVEDVTMRNNIMRRSAGGINILGRDNIHPSEQAKRIVIENNLFYELGEASLGFNGRFIQITGTVDVKVNHNTVFHTGNIITAYGKPNEGFVFTNNLMAHNEYGVIGDNTGSGSSTLNRYFPGLKFKKNVIVGANRSRYPDRKNYYPASFDDVRLLDLENGNYRLSGSSPYKGAGTKKSDIGADINAIEAATSGVI